MIYGNVFLKEGAMEKINIMSIKSLINTKNKGNIHRAYVEIYEGIKQGKFSAKAADELIQYIKPELKDDPSSYKVLVNTYCKAFPSEKGKYEKEEANDIADKDKFVKSVLIPKIKKYTAEVNKDEAIKKKAKVNMDKIEDESKKAPIRLTFIDVDMNRKDIILCDKSPEAKIALNCMINAVVDKLRKDTDLKKSKIQFFIEEDQHADGCIVFKF